MFFFILILLISSIHFFVEELEANPIYVTPPSPGLVMGGIIPGYTNYNISMKMADVKMIIKSDISKGVHPELFEANFIGSYRFFNPHETIRLTIAAPFYKMYSGILNSLSVTVNGTEEQNNITEITDDVFIAWNKYLINYYEREFVLTNITFEGGTYTLVEYNWNSSYDIVSYVYDVGTGRSWKGNITEKVEFCVEGYQPTKILDNKEETLSKKLQIIENNDSTSYIWFWDNEYIEEDFVGIQFSQSIIRQENRIRLMKIFCYIFSSLNVLILFPLIINLRKKKVEGKK